MEGVYTFQADPVRPLCLSIGGLGVELTVRSRRLFGLDEAYRGFLVEAPGEVKVAIEEDRPPPMPETSARIGAPGYWSLVAGKGSVLLETIDASTGKPYQSLLLRDGGREGAFHQHPEVPGPWITPLGYPLDYLAFSRLLLARGGAILHGGAVVHEGRALVFAGRKGAGKSTLARICLREGGLILGEEQIVLEAREGETWAYGTPWYGEIRICENMGAPVGGIFLLSHGAENRIEPVPPTHAASELLRRLFFAALLPGEIPLLLETCRRIASRTPLARLAFRPEPGLLGYLSSHASPAAHR